MISAAAGPVYVEGEPAESLHSRVDGRIHGITGLRLVGSRVLAVSKWRTTRLRLALSLGNLGFWSP